MASTCALAALQSQFQNLPLRAGQCALAGQHKNALGGDNFASKPRSTSDVPTSALEGSPVLLGIICAVYLSVWRAARVLQVVIGMGLLAAVSYAVKQYVAFKV